MKSQCVNCWDTYILTGDLGFGAGDNMLGDVHMDDTLFVKNPEQSLNEEGKEKAMDIDLQPPPSDFVNDLATYGKDSC